MPIKFCTDAMPFTDEEADSANRLEAASQAMQTGVTVSLKFTSDGTPESLRAGVNTALVNCGALAELLMQKGVFTRPEYLALFADAMEMECDDYKEILQEEMGVEVTLA